MITFYLLKINDARCRLSYNQGKYQLPLVCEVTKLL